MNLILFIGLWTIVIAGGLPSDIQATLEGRFRWWYPRLFGLLSSVLEFSCGLGILRLVLLMSGLGKLRIETGIILGSLGLFMLFEGLVRLASTRGLKTIAFPSLPVLIIVRVVARVFRST